MKFINKISRLFGEESHKEETSENEKPQMIDFDLLDKQRFVYAEAAYRHQPIVMPRSKINDSMTLDKVLEYLYSQKMPSIINMSVCSSNEGEEFTNRQYSQINDILKYDLFNAVSYKNDKGGFYPKTGENITLTLRIKNNDRTSSVVFFVRTTYIVFETFYIRISVMFASLENTDDLRTMCSHNAPQMISFLLVCDRSDNETHLTEYEELQESVRAKLNNDVHILDDVERELMYGIYEFRGSNYYYGYGKWMFEQDRFYDSYIALYRVYENIKNEFFKSDIDTQKIFYDVCHLMAVCLEKLGHLDKAIHFMQLAYDNDTSLKDELADCLAKYGDEKYDARLELRNNTGKFSPNITVGYVLNRLFDIKKNCVFTMSVCAPGNNDYTNVVIDNQNEIWAYNLSESLNDDMTIAITYSRVDYKTNDPIDKSKLCYDNSIIFRINSVNDKTNKKYMRVSIMIPNFILNDNKRTLVQMNVPSGISFIMNVNNFSEIFDFKDLKNIFHFSMLMKEQYRILEALHGFEYIFNRLKSDYLQLNTSQRANFYEAAFQVGFCLEELCQHESAIYYLEIASESNKIEHVQEYVNSLVNSQDIRSMSIIDKLQRTKIEGEPNSDVYKFHYAFLKRRKAYVLIDRQLYDEAETLLNEMLNDPLSKEFAMGELDYISRKKNE